MRNADGVGHAARIVDVLAGAAGALAVNGGTVVVELQRHADDVIALALQQRGDDRRIHAARHRHDDAGRRRLAGKIEIETHCRRDACCHQTRSIAPRPANVGP